MELKVTTILSKTFGVTKPPDVKGFVKSMQKLGAKVTNKNGTIVIKF